MAWCVRECGLLLSYPVLRLNSNFHFGKRLARISARTQTERASLVRFKNKGKISAQPQTLIMHTVFVERKQKG